MARGTIAIDVDEVLAAMNVALVNFHNEKYGTSLTKEDCKTYNLWKTFKCSKEESLKRINEFFASKHFQTILPVEGAVKAVADLVKDHNLIVMTSRFGSAVEYTEPWINQHFPDRFSKVIFTKAYDNKGCTKKTKSDFCKEHGVKAIIEDSPIYGKDCADQGIHVYLLEYPWNRDLEDHPLVTRVQNWSEAVDKLRNNK